MTTIRNQLTSLQSASAALARARSLHATDLQATWKHLQPILLQHENTIGSIFETAGYGEHYRKRFGQAYGTPMRSALGTTLRSTHLFPKHVLLTLGFSFRGEHQFKLPLTYIDGDPPALLKKDLARFKTLFERLALRQARERSRKALACERAEFERLSLKFNTEQGTSSLAPSPQPLIKATQC